MAASAPNNMPHDPRPTGDLEHLFRQTFAEAEIQPRTSLWEQLDHELVVQQNDTYRKRLVVHRWVAAACLLLALGFGGWAALRQLGKGPSAELAVATGSAGSRSTDFGATTQAETSAATRRGTSSSALGGLGQSAAATEESAGMLAAALGQSGASASAEATAPGSRYSHYSSADGYTAAGAGNEVAYEGGRLGGSYTSAAAANGYSGSQHGINYGFASQGQYGAGTSSTDILSLAYLQARLRNSLGLGLPDTLKPSLLARPNSAAAQLASVAAPTPEQPQTTPKLWHRLKLGGTYAASSYNPNINFSQADGRQNADAVTMALNRYYREDAETEYRSNLRPGLGQRLALTVDYALNKSLRLGSGIEVAEQRSTSATSYGFLDGQQPATSSSNLFRAAPSNYAAAPQVARATSFRYRSVGVPVTLHYGSTKAGASLYAKVGAAVNLLMSTHSELEGSPEATRTYTRSSSDLPYRKVMASLRGGAGVRYQPATATWSMAIGPVAEAGLTTLNANPNQATLHQSRPYSFGIEASVEFGATRPVVALH